MVDWSKWANEDEISLSQDLEGCISDGGDAAAGPNTSATDDEKKRQRARKDILTAGKNNLGQALPKDDTSSYSSQQRRCLDFERAQNAELDEEWKKLKTRDEKRMFVNAIVPHNISYTTRLDPKSTVAYVQRIVTMSRAKEDDKTCVGLTLTELEGTWGVDTVERGRMRGDIWEGGDGLWYRNTRQQKKMIKVADCVDISAKSSTQGNTVEDMQDNMIDWEGWCMIDDGESSKKQDDKRSVKTNASTNKIVTEEAMTCLQTAYDKCSTEIRKGKRLGRNLREVLDSACGEKGKSIDSSGTCGSALERLENLLHSVGNHVDTMDAMLFKPRQELFVEPVKKELGAVAPKYNEICDLNSELEGLLRTKNKALKRM